MLVVDRAVVGVVAFARMRREGLIYEAIGPRGLPLDIPSTRGTRWALVESFVPRDAWLTGLAALWLEGLCSPPRWLDLAGPRGRHTTMGTDVSPRRVMHSGAGAPKPERSVGPRATAVPRACLDALTHSPAVDALPAVALALRTGATSNAHLAEALSQVDPHTHGHARIASMLGALAEI